MKTTKIILVLAWLALASFAHAQMGPQARALTNSMFDTPMVWTITSSWYSEYLARPGFDLYDKQVSQNEITGRWHGLYGGLWSSTGLEHSSKMKYGQEFQTYLGLKWTNSWVALDGNVRYDALKELSVSRDDLWMVDMRADLTKVPIVQPYVATRFFHTVVGQKPSEGWFVWLGVRRSQDLHCGFPHCERAKLFADVSVACSDGALSRDAGLVYSRFCLQVNVPIAKHLAVAPQLLVQVPLDEQGKGHHPYTDGTTKFVGGLSAILRF